PGKVEPAPPGRANEQPRSGLPGGAAEGATELRRQFDYRLSPGRLHGAARPGARPGPSRGPARRIRSVAADPRIQARPKRQAAKRHPGPGGSREEQPTVKAGDEVQVTERSGGWTDNLR